MFYGWWIVLASVVGLLLSIAPVVTFTLGVFLKPLSQEFNWNRAEISFAYTLCTLAGSAALPILGRVVDRYGVRTVVVPSLLLFGACLISLYFLSAHLWHLYAVYLAIGLASSGSTPLPYARVISQWFDKRRGLALGLAMAGVGLGSFVMPSLAHTLVTARGWRTAYVCLGFLVIVIAVPTVGLLLKETPELLGLRPDGEAIPPAGATEPHGQRMGLSCHDAWRTSAFWLLTAAFFLVSVATSGAIVHLIPLLTDRGVSAQSAAFASSLSGGTVLIGRVWAGHLLDRFFAPYVTMSFFLALTLGLLLLWSGASGSVAFVAAMLVGLGLGAEVDIIGYLVGRYFGLLAFGEIYGYVFAAFYLGAGVGPLLMGRGFDATGSYSFVLGTFVILTLVASGLLSQLGPYRLWERIRPA
jgi:MFS family permease